MEKQQNNISNNIDKYKNNLTTKELKDEIIKSLKDWKVDQNEAKNLLELFWEINNINQETKQKWYNLSLDLRKDFQNKIWVTENWEIWTETLMKLSDIANIKIPLDTPKTRKLSENMQNNVANTRNSLSNLWIGLNPNNSPKNIFIQTDTIRNINIYNEGTKIPKTIIVSEKNLQHWIASFNNINPNQAENLYQNLEKKSEEIKRSWFQIKSIEISTTNDNVPPLAKSNSMWDDQWKSFWFEAKMILEKDGKNYILKWDISAYTDWTEIYNKNWKKVYKESWKDFLDVSNIQILKWVYNKENERWDNFYINIWWWTQARWLAPNFMKNIQNEWHKTISAYENISAYNWEKWFSTTLWLEASWKKYLYWDKNLWFYAWWNVDTNIALDKKWISEINAEWYVWANYKKIVDAQIWIWKSMTFWWQSEVLKFANWSNNYLYWNLEIWLWNLSSFLNVKIDPNSLNWWYNNKINERSSMKVWVKYTF